MSELKFPIDTRRRCQNCKFFCCRDYGHSNYTVTETEVECLKNHFGPIEESYSWHECPDNPFLKRAESCPDYKFGDGPSFDVDGETTNEDYKDDPELYELLNAE